MLFGLFGYPPHPRMAKANAIPMRDDDLIEGFKEACRLGDGNNRLRVFLVLPNAIGSTSTDIGCLHAFESMVDALM